MKLPPVLPLPSVWRSVQQWISAGFYTAVYGLPEFSHLLAFNLVRQFRKSQMQNGLLRQLERHFLSRAVAYRHRWARAFCSTFGIHVQLENRLGTVIPPQDRIIFVQLNQESMLEQPAFVLIAAHPSQHPLPHCFAFQNIEFALLPFFGWNLALPGVVIRRGSKKSTRAGVQRLLQRAKTFNDSFWISVEGQRSKDGQLSTYKKGAAIIAIESKSDIIPISFENVGQLWPYGHWQLRPGHVKVIVHERILTEGLTLNDKDVLTQRLRTLGEMEARRIKASVLSQNSVFS